MTSSRTTKRLGALLFGFALFAGGCASTPAGDNSDAGKVWMRADSTFSSNEQEASCQASTSFPADFKLCMQEAGWRLQTPPGE
jgi:hypothetical protein